MWALDFMYGTLYCGRSCGALNVIDESKREVLSIEIDLSLPKAIGLDNGSELRYAVITYRCAEQGINLKFIQLDKPQQNVFIERFNHTYRHEVINTHL